MPRRAASLAASPVRLAVPLTLLLLLGTSTLLVAQGNGNGGGSGGGGGITPMAESNGITVTTKPTVLPAKLPNTGPFTQVFTVYNDRNYSIAVEYSCNDVGPVSCGDVFPGADQIPGHSSENVTVEYSTTSGTGQAKVELIATLDVGSPPSSKGAVEFGVYGPGKGVPVPIVQRRDHLDRGRCFTSGAGAQAGLSCGDLFVVEGMPSFQTLGRDRSPTLYYNSATATGLTLVPMWYYEPATISMPASARAILDVGGRKDSVTFTPPASDCNYAQCADSFQVVVGHGLEWDSVPTGYHDATLTLRNLYSGAVHDSTVPLRLLVVNRNASGFGKGWSLLGVEELISDPDDADARIWLAGDGSARVFRRGIPLTSTMLTSSGVSGFNGTLAVDGSTSTAAWLSVAINGWIKVDLTTPRTVTTLGLHTLSGTSSAVWNIQYSDNGTTWKTVFASFKPASSGWRRVVWADAGAHRYWRLLRTGGSGPTISELSFGETNTWYGAPGAAPDSLVQFDSAGGTWYRRDLKHGATVTFDATGRHRATANRAGQQTRLVWTTVAGKPRLDSLVPPPEDTRGYKFRWNATTALLDSITDPTGRSLRTVMSSGRLIKVVSPGKLDSTRYAFDSRGVLTTRSVSRQHESVKGDSAITKYTYANNGRVTKVEIQADSAQSQFETITLTPWDERGLSGPVVVDSVGLPTRIDGPLADTADALDVLVDRFGAPRRMTHVGLGTVTRLWHDSTQTMPALVTRVELPHPTTAGAQGRVVTLSWNTRGNLVSQKDISTHLGDIGLPTKATTYTYADAAHPDAVTLVRDTLGREVTYSYDSLGLTATTTDARGHVTTFTHLPSGSQKGLLQRATEEDVLTWNQISGYASLKDLRRSFAYDTLGNLKTDSLPHGVRTLYVRDARGDVSAVWNYGGIKRGFVRDALGRVLQDQQSTVKQTIPGSLNLLAGCDTGTSICADSMRAVSAGIPATLTTTYVHSPSGITSVTDPRGVARSYRYGPRGEVRAETDDYGKRTVATTNAAGQLTSVLTRMNKTIEYTYDAYGRRASLAFPYVQYGLEQAAGDTLTYSYDLLGRMTLATGDEADVKRWYYADGSLKAVVSPHGVYDSISYTYDATGARTSMTVKDGLNVVDATTYTYDAAGDLDQMTVTWGGVTGALATPRVFQFDWDELGRRKQVGYPLGSMAAHYRYDATGTLRDMWVTNPPDPDGGNSLFGITEDVDTLAPSGRVLHRRVQCIALPEQLGNPCGALGINKLSSRFDRLGWLAAQHSNDTGLSDSLRYDASGNMTWRKQGLSQPKLFTMASGHNRLIKMTQAGSDSLQYEYDDDGNRAKDDDFDPSGYVRRAYFYDALGRTNGIFNVGTDADGYSYPMGGVNQCWHDALGRQIKACGYGVPFLTLDGQSIVRAENWRIRHGPGLDDPLIALARNDSYNEGVIPQEIYYLTDGAGRQYAVGEATGSIRTEIWNESVSQYLGARATGAVTQSHSFGEERLSTPRTPGLSYFRNRVYDQDTGRWTQEDPIGLAGGINLYQFNGNDPATYGDPYGLCPKSMKRDKKKCAEWNQRQVDSALAMIRKTSHPAVTPVHDGFQYRGANDDEMGLRYCRNLRKRSSKAGCTVGGRMTLNADREVANIAATIQHELEHFLDASNGNPQNTMRSEGCAQRREIQAGRVLGAVPDEYTPSTYNPTYDCSLQP